jgi:hypothetical protein
LLAGLLFLLVGASGVVLGVTLDRVIMHNRMLHRFFGRGAHEPPLEMRHHMVRRLTRELDLSEAQRALVDSILARQDSTLHELMRDLRPRFQELTSDTHTRIESVLTPAQLEKFRSMKPRPFLPFGDSAGRPSFRP